MKRIFLLILIIAVALLPSCINFHITNNYYGGELDNSVIDLVTKEKEEETKQAREE